MSSQDKLKQRTNIQTLKQIQTHSSRFIYFKVFDMDARAHECQNDERDQSQAKPYARWS